MTSLQQSDVLTPPAPRVPRIVVGLDGSYACAAALRWAAAQARERSAVLDLVAVWDDPALPTLTGPGERLQSARDHLQSALTTVLQQPDGPERITTTPLHGTAGAALVERARDADLLVLGTNGVNSLSIPGTVGLYCIRHSTTPVVFVPFTTEEFS